MEELATIEEEELTISAGHSVEYYFTPENIMIMGGIGMFLFLCCVMTTCYFICQYFKHRAEIEELHRESLKAKSMMEAEIGIIKQKTVQTTDLVTKMMAEEGPRSSQKLFKEEVPPDI